MDKTHLSRRHFLSLVGAAGGSTAVYQTSRALGLMQDTGPVAMLDLQTVGSTNKKVAILGAGIAGLTVAYELERAGYDDTPDPEGLPQTHDAFTCRTRDV